MGQKLAPVFEAPAMTRECQHYWVIATVKGPVSEGRCKFCGSQKEFKNYLQDCLSPENSEHWERITWQGGRKAEQAIISEIEQLLGVTPTLENSISEGVLVSNREGGLPEL
ncbi:MAG: hypothetical protein FJ012_10220 [Chloroflexi bacterium]|nr:hypothetical protein [Chloroflexota bacterium]